jgi:type IV secretion system protein VirD4
MFGMGPVYFFFLVDKKMTNDPEQFYPLAYPYPPPIASVRFDCFMSRTEAQKLRLDEPGKAKTKCPLVGALVVHPVDPVYVFARRPSLYSEKLPEGTGHIMTIAPTRAGKGTGQIIPNLLTLESSVLVLDVKGENYHLTAGCRAQKLKQNVFRFAPFEKDSEVWNPVLSIRANLNWTDSTHEERCHEEEDVSYLVELLISRSGSKQDVFWDHNASIALKGLLLHVRTAELSLKAEDAGKPEYEHRVRERSMREVRRLLTLTPENFFSLLKDMSESKRNLIREAGNSLIQCLSSDGLGQSILATLRTQTKVWSYERVYRATYKGSANPDNREPEPNDFTFSQMRDGKTSIYLIIPPEHLTEYHAVLRVMIGCAMRELKDSFAMTKNHPEYKDKPPVLFILDEFPQLAHMQPIQDALSYIAGYGVRLWFFVQDINQLKLHYKDSWQSFWANTEIKSFFGVNDIDTAKLVSELIGTTLTERHSNSQGSSESYSNRFVNSNWASPNTYSMSSSNTTALVPSPAISPEKIMQLREDMQIILIKGLVPILCYLLKYYQLPHMAELSEIPPPKETAFA